MKRLLSENFAGRDALLAQVENLKVKQIDMEGSLQLAPGPDAIRAKVEQRIPVEAEFPDDDGVSVRVLLHVVDGFLAELEIFKDDLTAIGKTVTPDNLQLRHADR